MLPERPHSSLSSGMRRTRDGGARGGLVIAAARPRHRHRVPAEPPSSFYGLVMAVGALNLLTELL